MAGARAERRIHQPAVRLNVEQASYAYAASEQSAPTFTLGATSFQAHEREMVAILGPNASGKSTLLRLITGTIAPLSGRVELEGQETSRLDVRTRAQRIAVVHQESPVVYPALAGDFVLQGRYPYGRALRFANQEDIEIARNALAQVGAEHLAKRTDRRTFRRRKTARDSGASAGATATADPARRADIASGHRRAGRIARALAATGAGKSLHRGGRDA